ncbi:MAG: CBS domain-containing protein [Gemmatimonadaceae bacterium]|nr:CBS domain-containing protein [Gemmatimonadaceae bacterium]
MLVRDAMTRRGHTIRNDKKLAAARAIMEWASVAHLPVVDAQGALVGVITHDTLRAATPAAIDATIPRAESDRTLAVTPVSNAIVSDVPSVSADAAAWQAAELMQQHRVTFLTVVDGTRVAGVVTASDLVAMIERTPNLRLSA